VLFVIYRAATPRWQPAHLERAVHPLFRDKPYYQLVFDGDARFYRPCHTPRRMWSFDTAPPLTLDVSVPTLFDRGRCAVNQLLDRAVLACRARGLSWCPDDGHLSADPPTEFRAR
jgi:hypothetical protein